MSYHPYPTDSRCWHCNKKQKLEWRERGMTQVDMASDYTVVGEHVVGAWLCRACRQEANRG